MLRSMTAYGRSTATSDLGRITVEIQSLNRKFLELNFFLPPELKRFESELRRKLSSQIGRGQVNVKVMAFYENGTPVTVVPNLPLAKEMKKAFEAIAKELNLNSELSLEVFLQKDDVLSYTENLNDNTQSEKVLLEAFDQALEKFFQMKRAEAQSLLIDIEQRLEKLTQGIDQIEKLSSEAPKKYRQKLIERLQEVIQTLTPAVTLENDERILKEVCLFADKIDIAEELTRFRAHIQRLKQFLHGSDQIVGKTIEFLLQELGREINTIGSKSQEAQIAHLVVDIKSEIERIREQIQNVE